jgi:capsular exopolysaccharide synthesis family protein
LRSTEDVTATLQLPVIGAIPACSNWWKRRVLGQVTHIKSQSAVAEAYRTVSAAVASSATDAKAASILVSSAVAGEGKSTLVSNLAIALAQAGQKIVIVDADFRAPVQDMIFKLDHDNAGLHGVLKESHKLAETVQATRIKNLDVLTCGRQVANPSELLNSKGFAEVLDRLRERYDLILIDSPPIAPFADARLLAGKAGATLLVLRVEKSKRTVACEACEGLRAVRARILGIVLSNVHEKDGRNGYFNGHKDYYKPSRHSLRAREWRHRVKEQNALAAPTAAAAGSEAMPAYVEPTCSSAEPAPTL